MSALNIYLISGRIVSSVAFSCRFFQFQAREDTSQNESYYICLIREPWRDLWHGARRFKLFSFWMCQGQARQCKILQNLLLQRKKRNFWDVYCIINSHAAMSGDLRWSQSFFSGFGVYWGQSQSPMTATCCQTKAGSPSQMCSWSNSGDPHWAPLPLLHFC